MWKENADSWTFANAGKDRSEVSLDVGWDEEKEANQSSFVNLGVKILSNERREFLSDDSRHRAYEMLDEQ